VLGGCRGRRGLPCDAIGAQEILCGTIRPVHWGVSEGGSRRRRRIIGKQPERPGVGLRGQSCDQSPGGRRGKLLYEFQILGALEGCGERIILWRVVGAGFGFRRSIRSDGRNGTLVVSRNARFTDASGRGTGDAIAGFCAFPLHEPRGPERRGSTFGTGLQCGGTVVDAVGSAGVSGRKPLFQIPQKRTGHAANEGCHGAWRYLPARVHKVVRLHLPVNDVTAARPKGAQRQRHRTRGIALSSARGTQRDDSRQMSTHCPRGFRRFAGRTDRGQCGSRREHAFLSAPISSQ